MYKLNVEVVFKANSPVKRNSLTAHVKEELMKREILRIGSKLTKFEIEALSENVEAIYICEVEQDGSSDINLEDGSTVSVNDVHLSIYSYHLNKDGVGSESIGVDDSEASVVAPHPLPSSAFHGLWDSLIFDSDIKRDLLQYARAMLHLSRSGVNHQLISCNRVVLLHGPPGTGKTSLCKALAQKLSIRMASTYPQALLLEINTHGLFSKYFSESGKLVSKLFTRLAEMASDPQTLLFVLVDEVESLAHSRASFTGNEPSDAIRVVNALLTHLDMLKDQSNVMIFTTSNISGAIDIAFVDRADIRAFIPQPSSWAIYSILHSCLQELLKAGLIMGTCPDQKIDRKQLINGFVNEKKEVPGQVENLLLQLAKESEGLTGRSLRKVPLRVFSSQINPGKIVRVEEFISAMMIIVKKMKLEQQEINKTVSLS